MSCPCRPKDDDAEDDQQCRDKRVDRSLRVLAAIQPALAGTVCIDVFRCETVAGHVDGSGAPLWFVAGKAVVSLAPVVSVLDSHWSFLYRACNNEEYRPLFARLA